MEMKEAFKLATLPGTVHRTKRGEKCITCNIGAVDESSYRHKMGKLITYMYIIIYTCIYIAYMYSV